MDIHKIFQKIKYRCMCNFQNFLKGIMKVQKVLVVCRRQAQNQVLIGYNDVKWSAYGNSRAWSERDAVSDIFSPGFL